MKKKINRTPTVQLKKELNEAIGKGHETAKFVTHIQDQLHVRYIQKQAST